MLAVNKMIRIILIGAIITIFYWAVESIIMVNVFHDGDFIEQFFHPNSHELWMRTSSALLLFTFVSFGQYMLATQKMTITKLEETLAEVNTLSGLLPICAWCKKLRDEEGYWKSVEAYISAHTGAEFTHGMCPECYEKVLAEGISKENSNNKVN